MSEFVTLRSYEFVRERHFIMEKDISKWHPDVRVRDFAMLFVFVGEQRL